MPKKPWPQQEIFLYKNAISELVGFVPPPGLTLPLELFYTHQLVHLTYIAKMATTMLQALVEDTSS